MLRRRVGACSTVPVAPTSCRIPIGGGSGCSAGASRLSVRSFCFSGAFTPTAVSQYVYKPPGSSEPSRLPWYQPVSPSSAAAAAAAVQSALASTAPGLPNSKTSPPNPVTTPPQHRPLQPHQQQHQPTQGTVETSHYRTPAATIHFEGGGGGRGEESVTASTAATAVAATPPSPAPPSPSPLMSATQVPQEAALQHRPPSQQRGSPSSSNAVHRPAAPHRSPTLDARIEDIVKVEEMRTSELTLPKVVQLLIDPQAEGVERIAMSDFVAMQPKRRLMALGGHKEWLKWVEQSHYYQQAARLAAESPAQDLAALQQAGVHSLQQWLEHPQLVKVSARTRSALDTAAAQSVEAYMAEVAAVVNTSHQVEGVLSQWVADVIGKFLLDSLQIPLDRASQAMWIKRAAWMPADTVRGGGVGAGGPTHGSFGGDAMGRSSAMKAASLALSAAMRGEGYSDTTSAKYAVAGQQPMLPPGEACTLDHYRRFVEKVMSSVRQDYIANHAAMGLSPGGRGDTQAELEIAERSYSVIAAAFTQVLEQAMLHQLPPDLRSLQHKGYLALDRVPGLLKRAGSLLELRTVPVRYFVFHSSAADAAVTTTPGRLAREETLHNTGAPSGLTVSAPRHFVTGTFLTGSNQLDVTLGEWSGQPDPPSSTARESGGVVDDATEQEYLSVLHRLRRRVDTLAVTSLFEVIAQPERYGGNGFSAVEAIGLHQLFGPAKLLEDRLTTLLHYPPAAADKPIHFIEAGPLSGKTALLEQLAERIARPGDRVILVRYGGSATPYLPDLDDHPVAFASRFWFRVALASCPYLVRTEELYSRAPRSVAWWGHEKNWSWERYQSLLQSAHNPGAGFRQHQQQLQRGVTPAASAPAQLATILVDDVDRALSAMQVKWGSAAAWSSAAAVGGSRVMVGSALTGHSVGNNWETRASQLHVSTAAATARQQQEDADEDGDEELGEEDAEDGSGGGAPGRATATAAVLAVPSPTLEQQHQQVEALWASSGKSVEEHLSLCFSQISAAVGQVNLVFTGTAAPPLLLAHCPAPCRRYYLSLSGGVGLPSRLRVLPLLATLHALHQAQQLDMPGLLYEVLKYAPALAGKTLELFWSHRVSLMNLRTGLPRLMMGTSSAHPQLRQSYVPRELFAELPLYIALLQNPRRTRRRLVELLQRQLSSPTGYLSTELDTTPQDVRDGLVLPHNHTSSQVHPFAVFAIFSRQDAIDERALNTEVGEGDAGGELLLDVENVGCEEAMERTGERDEGAAAVAGAPRQGERSSGSAHGGGGRRGKGTMVPSSEGVVAAATVNTNATARLRISSTGVGNSERKVVRAWAEVWAEYRGAVSTLSTAPARKRDAMRILLHGALLLRSAAVAGAQLELNLRVPSFGFPLLASEMRVRAREAAPHQRGTAVPGESTVRSATPDTVRRAVSAYKMFFASAAPSHFPFRPLVGLNGGCDVVFVCGSTLALYDIVTSSAQLRHVVGRFAEALLGVLHVLERQVLPLDKVRSLHYVTVVSVDEARPGVVADSAAESYGSAFSRRRGSAAHAATAGGLSVDTFSASAGLVVPHYLDYEAVFDDDVIDRLRELQQCLGITKDFRTLSELKDAIERTHRVRVQQDIITTPEELESLFSPTLLQLVPDSTLLPAYTSSVVSAADLMAQAMMHRGGPQGASGVVNGGEALDDDDDETDYVNIGDDDVHLGAEVDDQASDARLSRDTAATLAQNGTAGGGVTFGNRSEELLNADGDLLLGESAALLEAMMNDELDVMTDSSARIQQQREETARDLRRDLVMEDHINYNAPPPTTSARGTTVPGATAGATAGSGRHSAAEDAEADALAWLHDVITPESLLAGYRGANNGTAAPTAPLPVDAAGAGGLGSIPYGFGPSGSPATAVPAAGGGGAAAAAAPFGGSAVPPATPPQLPTIYPLNVAEPWTPNPAPSQVFASEATEALSSVFPRTASKRNGSQDPRDTAGVVDGDVEAATNKVVDAREAGGQDEVEGEDEGEDEEEGHDGADADKQEEEDEETLDLQKLFDAVGQRQRKARGGRKNSASTKKKMDSSRRPRRAARGSSTSAPSSPKVRRPSSTNGAAAKMSGRSSLAVARPRKASSSTTSSSSKRSRSFSASTSSAVSHKKKSSSAASHRKRS